MTISMNSRQARSWMNVQTTISGAVEIERRWQATRPDGDALKTPFMPLEMFAFISLLAEAMPEIRGGRFLDIGCGPGAKMMVAADVFGLNVRGFDISQPMVEAARGMELDAVVSDAMDYDGYADADLVWFNRVFRDRKAQSLLEEKIWPQLAPGTVVICANLEWAPPASWPLILDDMEIRRGIWQKGPVAPAAETI